MDRRAFIESFDFKVVPWAEIPPRLLDRALSVTQPEDRHWVLYDPIDDEDGFLLIGADLDTVETEGYNHILECEPVDASALTHVNANH